MAEKSNRIHQPGTRAFCNFDSIKSSPGQTLGLWRRAGRGFEEGRSTGFCQQPQGQVRYLCGEWRKSVVGRTKAKDSYCQDSSERVQTGADGRGYFGFGQKERVDAALDSEIVAVWLHVNQHNPQEEGFIWLRKSIQADGREQHKDHQHSGVKKRGWFIENQRQSWELIVA